jgi:opacity protein-like surface antigen
LALSEIYVLPHGVLDKPKLVELCKGKRRNIMKNFLILSSLVVVLCLATSTYGQDTSDRGAYIGIGGSYALEFEHMDHFEDAFSPVKTNFDKARGMHLKFGYHVNDFFCMEGVFDYLPGFETDETWTDGSRVENAEADIDIMTLMVAAKLHIPSDIVQPFCVVGVGLMHAEIDAERYESALGTVSGSDSDVQSCAKVGVGFDLFLARNVSIGMEGSYVFGLEECSFQSDAFKEDHADMDVRYWNIAFGLAYHF